MPDDGGAAKNIVNLAEWIEARTPGDETGGGGAGPPPGGPPAGEEPEAFYASDDFLAMQLVDALAPDLAYVANWGQWLIWRDSYWRREHTLALFTHARRICRMVRKALDATPAVLRGLESAKTVAAAVGLARSDPRVLSSEAIWDTDWHLLNCPGGIVDLRTGVLMGSDRDRRMTQLAGATPQGDCPHWRRFLKEVTGGNQAYEDYLQRLVGFH